MTLMQINVKARSTLALIGKFLAPTLARTLLLWEHVTNHNVEEEAHHTNLTELRLRARTLLLIKTHHLSRCMRIRTQEKHPASLPFPAQTPQNGSAKMYLELGVLSEGAHGRTGTPTQYQFNW